LVFATAISAATVLAWPLIREVGLWVTAFFVWPSSTWWRCITTWGISVLATPSRWTDVWLWEAWSLARWWLLFASLTALLPSGRRAASAPTRRKGAWQGTCRLLLFAPWLLVLEVGFLIGVWIESPMTVPEPSTIFVTLWSWTEWLDRTWLIRGTVPAFGVGFVYFRYVLGWRRTASVLASIVFIPAALIVSVIWSHIFVTYIW